MSRRSPVRPAIVFCCCLLCASLLSGCWDRVEIEERGFVVAAAIDVADKESEPDLYRLTYQFVVPGELQGEGGGGIGSAKGGSRSQGAYLNATTEAEDIIEASGLMFTKISRIPFLEHLKVIIISEEVGKSQEISDVLDLFVRDYESRRAAKVIVAEGKAEDILEVMPQIENIPALFIDMISENSIRNARMLPFTRIGDLQEYLLKNRSFLAQRITAQKASGVIVSGAAVFNSESKLAGFLNEKETIGLNLITGKNQGGQLKIDWKGKPIVYEFRKPKRKYKVDATNKERIKFTVSIDTEGVISETHSNPDLLDPKVKAELEERIEEQMQQLAML